MKKRIILMIETGVAIAAVSALVAFNSSRAASEKPAPDTDKPTATEPADANAATPVEPERESDGTESSVVPEKQSAPAPLHLTVGMKEIVELARSGVSEEVLNAYVEKSGRVYHPSVDEIIYLKDLGVAPGAIATLIRTGDRESNANAQVAEPARPDSNSTADATPPPPQSDLLERDTTTPQPPIADAVPAPNAPADAPVNLDYFRASLAAYGSWIYVDGYGECWRPSVAIADVGWRPYFDSGRWVYTNCGWYWLSDYSWGWAAFHYGRWMRNGRWGWVWVPGYTWGPAWVEWRMADDYCGWAPLPPVFSSTFSLAYLDNSWGFSIGWDFYNWIPYRYCSGYYPRHFAARHGLGHEIFEHSRPVRPIVVGSNNSVIVTGPDARQVANAGHVEIRRVHIRDVQGGRGGRDFLESGGQTLAAFRPTLRPDRVRPETELANRRAEFRRASLVMPTAEGISTSQSARGLENNSRNIILRGNSSGRESSGSFSRWQEGISRQSSGIAETERRPGQNTTINPRPEYARPAVESTPILSGGRALTYTPPVTINEPVIGGAASTVGNRPTRYWNGGVDRSLNSVSRQIDEPRNRFNRPAANAVAPTYTPPQRPAFDASRSSEPANRSFNQRSENPRGFSPSRSSSIPSGVTIPPAASRFSSPSFSQPSRPSFSRESSRPAFSQSAGQAPARSFYSPPASFAPSRSVNSGGGNSVRPSRGGSPGRRNE